MKTGKNVYRTTLLSLATVAALTIGLQNAFADDDEKEEAVGLKQVPEAVQDTLERESTGGKIKKIEKETRGRRTIYEADITIDGKEYEAKIASDGTLLVKKLEHEKHGRKHHEEMEEHHGRKHMKKQEQKIAVADVPAKVMKAVNKAVPGGTVKEAEKETYGGKKVIYEVEKVVDGKEVEIKVTPNGKVIKVERDDDDDKDKGRHDDDDDDDDNDDD